VGKFVVCSKSAGPFHQLHKKCLPTYQGTRKCLHESISACLEVGDTNSELISNIQSCKPREKFSASQFKELVIEAWQKQAKQIVKKPTLDVASAKVLVNIANEFEIGNENVEDYLLVRLSNIEHLDHFQRNQTIEERFVEVPSGVELAQNESIVWEFNDTSKAEQQRYSQEKEWTVFSTVMNNALFKKRYKDLAVSTEEAGTLLVTNHGIFYKNKQEVSHTKFSEIYSITPMKTGVRVQANNRDSVPETYVTGDGRFTYTLLQHVQDINGY